MNAPEPTSDEAFAQQVRRALHALPDAPTAWQQAAIGLWPAPSPLGATAQALGDTAAALGRWVAAVLTFDSWAQPAVAHGMRSLRGSTRHLLYSAEGRDIDLRITPAAERYTLSGQILGPDETGQIELALLDDTGTPTTAALHRGELDALGEFRLESVPAGRYLLRLRAGSVPIVVQPIDVGEQAG